MATLLFFDEGHKYTLDGEELPSVTQLVAPLGKDMDDPDEMDDFMEGVLDTASDRGVTMHAFLAHRLSGGTPEEFEMPDSYMGYVDSVERFLSEHSIAPLLIETPLSTNSYAGTPDLVCEFDGETAIIDYKFVSQMAKSKVGAQLAGYRELCEYNGIYTERLYAVQFLNGGDYRLYPVAQAASEEAFNLCKELHRIKTKKHQRGVIS